MLGPKLCSTPVISDAKMSEHDGIHLEDIPLNTCLQLVRFNILHGPDLRFLILSIRCVSICIRQLTLHFVAAQRILIYLKSTLDYEIILQKGFVALNAYSDVDWVGNPDDRRGTSRFCIFTGTNHITQCSKKQATVSISSTEEEYKFLAQKTVEVVWVCQLLKDLYIFFPFTPTIGGDNTLVVLHQLLIYFHFIRELVNSRLLSFNTPPPVSKLWIISPKVSRSAARFDFLRDKLIVHQDAQLNLWMDNSITNDS